ncbi:MAG: hypothetical protein M9928_06035 [Anaerolineae bacterium]|nr:hypothetical protein [Anaerolineae bacterium]MCO5192800.1 hypothetical protein [Anaerolineae bacterium]MCO5197004.1 hypothetical protein [Anaerolineae bacterium]MCO5204567.1 hypothetical protein [Anaerolineae bacterium]
MQSTITYAIGDWIAHSYYGIGQIECIEAKGISGEEADYYRIRTNDSVFWVPVAHADDGTVRPLSSLEEIRQALEALTEPPKSMSANYKLRKSRLLKAQTSNSPQAFAKAIRDLRAFKQQKKSGLNVTERNALKTLQKRLANEWALVAGMPPENASTKIENILAA